MDIVENFNKNIKLLFAAFKDLKSQKFKTKLVISELGNKINEGMRLEPQYAITIFGPILWACRNEVMERNFKYFLDYRYEIPVQQFAIKNTIDYDLMINTINFMVDAFHNSSESIKNQIHDIVVQLVVNYAQYLQTQRV